MSLALAEVDRLQELEETVERGLATFVEVGQALMEIRDSRLYRSSHSTFEDYCRERWGWTRQHANRTIRAAEVAGVLEPTGSIPVRERLDNPATWSPGLSRAMNERQARELAPLLDQPEVLRETWAEVVEIHPEPTADDVREAVDRRLGITSVLGSSESDEWYTPGEYIDAARRVLGHIDLDPASCEAANQVVRADTFYSIDNDGLTQPWTGRVYMNPPYGNAVGQFVSRLVDEFNTGNVTAAVMLTAARLETRWFAPLFDHLLCFPSRRVKFWQPGREVVSPPFTPAFAYLGADTAAFVREFSTFGPVVRRIDG